MLRQLGIVTALAVTVGALAGCPRESPQPQPYGGFGASTPYPPGTTPYPPGTTPYPPGTTPYPPGTTPYPPGTTPYPPGTTPYPPNTTPYPPNTTPYPPSTTPAPTTSSPWPFPFPFPFPTTTAPAPQPTPTSPPVPTPTSPFPPGPQPPSGGGTAQPIDPNLASAATVPLMAVAQQEAAGMRETTPIVAAQFQAGQTMDAPFQLMPGKCYTVIAVGAGIGEMDIKIVALQPIPGVQNPVLAQDNSTGNTAVLGGRGQCFKWAWPFGMNAKAVFTATSGQGIAAGRVYEK